MPSSGFDIQGGHKINRFIVKIVIVDGWLLTTFPVRTANPTMEQVQDYPQKSMV